MYATNIFIPYVERQLALVSPVEVIWDRYLNNSLKETTHANRDSGVWTKVTGSGRLPKNWDKFLRNNQNKTELFQALDGHARIAHW